MNSKATAVDEAGGPRHIFISYDPADSGDADLVQAALEAAGVRVWNDFADVRPGEIRQDRIRQAISGNALVFLACFSKASTTSVRSRQHEELTWAVHELRQRHPSLPWLIPVRFDDCMIPDLDIGAGRSLQSLSTADLFRADGHDELARLVETVIWILSRSSPGTRRRRPTVNERRSGGGNLAAQIFQRQNKDFGKGRERLNHIPKDR